MGTLARTADRRTLRRQERCRVGLIEGEEVAVEAPSCAWEKRGAVKSLTNCLSSSGHGHFLNSGIQKPKDIEMTARETTKVALLWRGDREARRNATPHDSRLNRV